jgi:hypothetical protein
MTSNMYIVYPRQQHSALFKFTWWVWQDSSWHTKQICSEIKFIWSNSSLSSNLIYIYIYNYVNLTFEGPIRVKDWYWGFIFFHLNDWMLEHTFMLSIKCTRKHLYCASCCHAGNCILQITNNASTSFIIID